VFDQYGLTAGKEEPEKDIWTHAVIWKNPISHSSRGYLGEPDLYRFRQLHSRDKWPISEFSHRKMRWEKRGSVSKGVYYRYGKHVDQIIIRLTVKAY
jgi:hypothetical protein